MPDSDRSAGHRGFRLRLPDGFTIFVIVVCGSIELALSLADAGLIPVPRLRILAYVYGGFWPGLLGDWQPNYAAQPALMFLTYGFLHGGPIHLVVNMITLLSLGSAVKSVSGTFRYALIYIASILGGAIGFAVLATGVQPMVGASGALFGLAGALVAWELGERLRERITLAPVIRFVVLLLVLNLVLWWAMSGQLAWQTHLGGFVAGATVGHLLRR